MTDTEQHILDVRAQCAAVKVVVQALALTVEHQTPGYREQLLKAVSGREEAIFAAGPTGAVADYLRQRILAEIEDILTD